MSSRKTGGKHRAPRRPVTPLTTIAEHVSGPVGRRAAAAAASTGIIVTLTAAGSVAAPHTGDVQLAKVPTIRTLGSGDSVTGGGTVTVAKDAKWSFVSAATGTSATPAPPPPPVVRAPAVNRTASVSRSGTRQAAPAASSTPAPQVSSAPATATGAAIVAEARKYIGTPYRHGGSTPAAFDCSGFTSYVFAKFGVNLPRSSGAQRGAGRVVSAAEARPGDLVWWPGHVGIYTGNGNHIAARNPGTALYEGPIFHNSPTFIRVL